MKRPYRRLSAGIVLGILAAASTAAADGQAMFLEKCGACHKSGGKAPVINPADKAGQVWVNYFARGRHPVHTGIAEADMKQILDFISSHAADSDQPAAAVIPK